MNRTRLMGIFLMIAALVFAGCGGGGGTSLMVDGQRATQALINALQQKYNDAKTSVMTLEGQLGDANDMIETLNTQIAAAPTQAMVNELTTKRDEYKRKAEDLEEQLETANNTITILEAQLPPTEDPDPARTKAAGTKRKAIAAEAAQTTDAGLGGTARTDADGTTTDADTSDDVYGLSISRDRSRTTIKITDPDMAGMDDPKFTQAMDLGGGTTMHVRTMDADADGDVVSEVVMVTTDIGPPRGVAFGRFQNAAGTATQPLNAEADGTADDSTAFVAYDLGTGALVSTESAQKAILDNVMSASFSAPPTGSASAKHTFLPADEDEKRAAAAVMGTYNGAMGTYTCSGTARCEVTVNAMGMLTAMTDGWIFTPVAGATSDQPDYDYMSYGFWLKRTTDSDDVLTYDEVETFANSSVDLSGRVADVTGAATYNGGATGVYVHSVTDQDGDEILATSGHFMADVELTATFGQVPVSDADTTGTIAPNLLNTLSGTIDDFQLSGHDRAPGWSVTLQGDITNTTGLVTGGTAKGGMGDGSFNAAFHGPTGTGGTDKPHSVVGEFNAGFSNGSVAGAFGARRKP